MSKSNVVYHPESWGETLDLITLQVPFPYRLSARVGSMWQGSYPIRSFEGLNFMLPDVATLSPDRLVGVFVLRNGAIRITRKYQPILMVRIPYYPEYFTGPRR